MCSVFQHAGDPVLPDFLEVGDHTVGITIDGNFQQKRYWDRSPLEFEVLTPKTFVNYLCRDYSLASEGIEGNEVVIGCNNNWGME